MRDDVAEHYDTHKPTCVVQCLGTRFATREEYKYRVEEEEEDEHDAHTEREVQEYSIAEDILRCTLVSLA